jgi:hypothetical protein
MLLNIESCRERHVAMTKDNFIQRLKNEIVQYEASAESLESGKETLGHYRQGMFTDKSFEMAAHYQRVISTYEAIIDRHEKQ